MTARNPTDLIEHRTRGQRSPRESLPSFASAAAPQKGKKEVGKNPITSSNQTKTKTPKTNNCNVTRNRKRHVTETEYTNINIQTLLCSALLCSATQPNNQPTMTTPSPINPVQSTEGTPLPRLISSHLIAIPKRTLSYPLHSVGNQNRRRRRAKRRRAREKTRALASYLI